SDVCSSDLDETVDVIGERAALIRLQQARIRVDWNHEQQMGKLFSSLGREIALLSGLLTDHKADLQDVGLLPKSPEEIRVTSRQEQATVAPRASTLGELLGSTETDPVKMQEIARALHNVIPMNGHRAVGQ